MNPPWVANFKGELRLAAIIGVGAFYVCAIVDISGV